MRVREQRAAHPGDQQSNQDGRKGQHDVAHPHQQTVDPAAKETGLSLPLMVRLEGNNVDAGKATLAASGLNIVSADGMDDGAKKICAAVA